mgnify:CR=1 FL=1
MRGAFFFQGSGARSVGPSMARSVGRLAATTRVVYTTDHGENMGEHGLWWKNCMYEQAAHIPLIVSWPEKVRLQPLADLGKRFAGVGTIRVEWEGAP